MCSQDSVTGPYGHTFSFPDIMGKQDSSLVLFIATQSPFSRSWVVKTPSPGHMATHSPSPISWANKTRHLYCLLRHNLLFRDPG
ncbi:hypothetical protein Bpfe_002062 [Biomphalaria pfeifferi]|uniref:Uncharacterized protein n=1 Tax=Biomphalaria pfeifferi TaxID=112525 RepID=A0AAD8C810_BIOPF|nr:hypothetical protein Bpfe_002062 [Biomphalaria pfeifferi]